MGDVIQLPTKQVEDTAKIVKTLPDHELKDVLAKSFANATIAKSFKIIVENVKSVDPEAHAAMRVAQTVVDEYLNLHMLAVAEAKRRGLS